MACLYPLKSCIGDGTFELGDGTAKSSAKEKRQSARSL
jgi:hypothetical protein